MKTCSNLRTKALAVTFILSLSLSVLAKDDFTLVSGSYQVNVNIKRCVYSVSKIMYENFPVGADTGFYGTVFDYDNGKMVGTGHAEGGREELKSVSLTVDGKEVVPRDGGKYEGGKIILKKTSHIADLLFNSEIELTENGLRETKNFEAVENQKVYFLCLFLYCCNVATKEWLAMLPDGQIKEGKFKDDGGWHISNSIKWVSLYDPASEKGMIFYFPKVVPTPRLPRITGIWDVKNKYHKLDIFLKLPEIIPKGEKYGPYTLIFKAFSAKPDEWKSESKKLADCLAAHRTEFSKRENFQPFR